MKIFAKQVACGLMMSLAMLTTHAAAEEKLRLAINQNFPPFVEVVDGEPQGILVDLLVKAAEKGGVEVQFIPVSLDQWQTVVSRGDADAFYPMAITPALRESYDFSDPIASSGGGLFVKSPEETPDGLNELAGKVVVTPAVGPLAAYISKVAPAVRLEVTKDYQESIEKVISGDADAAALNLQVGVKLAAQNYPGKITPPDRYFWELPLAVALRKEEAGSSKTLIKLNQGIAAIRADGTMDRILKKDVAR